MHFHQTRITIHIKNLCFIQVPLNRNEMWVTVGPRTANFEAWDWNH